MSIKKARSYPGEELIYFRFIPDRAYLIKQYNVLNRSIVSIFEKDLSIYILLI
jgi:hypothetical protein